jgi:hypothetical protein
MLIPSSASQRIAVLAARAARFGSSLPVVILFPLRASLESGALVIANVVTVLAKNQEQ